MRLWAANLLILLSAATALGGWTTNLYDGASNQWGYGKTRAAEVTAAVLERAAVAASSTNITARQWGSSWTLEEAKDCIAEPYGWMDPELLGTSTVAQWLDDNSVASVYYGVYCTNSLDYTTSSLLANASASTNWFANDPHWGAVTHDDGWQWADDVINLMTVHYYILQPYELDQGGDVSAITITGMAWEESGGSTNSYAEAISNAEANLIVATNGTPEIRNEAYLAQPDGVTYQASRSWGGIVIELPATNVYSSVDVYAATAFLHSAYGMVTWTNNLEWTAVKTVAINATNTVITLGPQQYSDGIPWPSVGSAPADEGWQIWGGSMTAGSIALFRDCEVTNGFEYVEE